MQFTPTQHQSTTRSRIIISLQRVTFVHWTIIKYGIQVREGKVCYRRGLSFIVNLVSTLNIIPNKGITKTEKLDKILNYKQQCYKN